MKALKTNLKKGATYLSNFAKSSLGSNLINASVTGYMAYAFGKIGSQEKIDNLGKIIDSQNLSLIEYDNREKINNDRRSTITEKENKLIDEVRFLDRQFNNCKRDEDLCRRDLEKSILPLRYSLFKTYCHRMNQLEAALIQTNSLKL
jgi:hypothetical protein